MKKFLKMVLAVMCGILLMWVLGFIILASIAGAASGGNGTVIPKSGVLAIDMSAITITEQSAPANPMASIQGKDIVQIGLYKAVQAIHAAADDPGVKFIFLRTDGNSTSITHLQELRKALADFRKEGKAVVAYTETPSTASYYLASVADKVYITSYDGVTVTINGVSAQTVYFKDLLDRLGVNVQLIRHGKYKSAGEMFVRNSPSAENKEQYERMVKSMWESISAEIAESRGISVAKLNAMVDGLELCLPQDLLERGLVDGVLNRSELKEKLADLAVADRFKDVKFIPFDAYADAKVLPNFRAHKKIAVIYAEGNIVDGKDMQNIAGDRFASIIDKVRSDSTVKAVVLRVNSPGGSSMASDKIKHELDLLASVKPLAASYGDYAASGGYWISHNCDKIFSCPTTLTGSIGVFGMIPDFSRTAKDVLHVGVFTAMSNKHGDMWGVMRPFDAAEYNYMLRCIENTYDKFTSIVAEGRSLDKAYVDKIGQGRVWTGADALNIGLVDELGTLEDAISWAAAASGDADLANWQIAEYPKPLTEIESIMVALGQKLEPDEYVKAQIAEMAKPQVIARMPYQVTIF